MEPAAAERKTRATVVLPNRDGCTVESILIHELEVSASRISRLKRIPSGVVVNGVPVYMTAHVRSGDVVEIQIQDCPLKKTAEPRVFPLKIVYEDEQIAIIDKPAGIVVHPTKNPDEMTLENAFAYYFGTNLVAHPVSRLDKGTSGLMTVAKNGYVHELLKRRMHSPDFQREYRAIAVGRVKPDSGEIYGSIDFAGEKSYKRKIVEDGPPARTGFEVLSYYGDYTYLKLIPFTGKTHQLRIHMASIGYPLAGDYMYGKEDLSLIGRPALHSYEIWMVHPFTGEKLHFCSPIPDDMKSILYDVSIR